MQRCFGYVRVSSAKQGEGVSLAEQRESIRRYAQRHDLDVIEWFEERETAAKSGRPVFRKVLQRLKKGQADGLIIHKIDRSARNLRDWADLGEFIDARQIHFAHESLDLSTRGGRLAADIQAVVAADYIRNLSDETRKGHLGRLRQGVYPFRAPIGYHDGGRGKPKEQDPVMAPLIRTAFELYATGEYSLEVLAAELHRRGLRTGPGGQIRKSRLAEILRNSFYVGVMRLPSTGEVFPGKHRPIVTRVLFDSVCSRLDGRAVRGDATHDYLFRRLFRCGHCKRYLVGERQKGRVYYRCHARACLSRTVREDRIVVRVREVLASLRFRPNELAWLRQEIELRREDELTQSRIAVAALRRDLEAIRSRLASLTTAFVDGDVDRDTYLATKERILVEQQRKQESHQRLQAHPAAGLDRVLKTLELAASALQTFDTAEPPEKRELLDTVSSNRTLEGDELSVEPAFPFSELVFSPCAPQLCTDQDAARTSRGRRSQPPERGARELITILKLLLKCANGEKGSNSHNPSAESGCRSS